MSLKAFYLDGDLYLARNLTDALADFARLNHGETPIIIEQGKTHGEL